MTELRKGLFYEIKQQSSLPVNRVFIENKNDRLSFVFHFSDSEEPSVEESNTHAISFVFSYDYLSEVAADLIQVLDFPTTLEHDFCCNTRLMLFDLLRTKYEGVYKRIFIESKALELLLCTHKSCHTVFSPCDQCKFLDNDYEKEKIFFARELILSRLDSPLTIPELAKAIGLNQCYLKKGFKQLFNTTIYEYVQEQRMIKARLLLSSAQYSVSRVAEMVGFSSTSSFTIAFKKQTGLLPSEFTAN